MLWDFNSAYHRSGSRTADVSPAGNGGSGSISPGAWPRGGRLVSALTRRYSGGRRTRKIASHRPFGGITKSGSVPSTALRSSFAGAGRDWPLPSSFTGAILG